jgi:hypothetical protein
MVIFGFGLLTLGYLQSVVPETGFTAFVVASVLVGMDDSFIAPARPSSLAASVAEAVHAAALESALESAAASSQPAVVTAAVTETPAAAPAVPAATERRRAPNDPRNRLPPQ